MSRVKPQYMCFQLISNRSKQCGASAHILPLG